MISTLGIVSSEEIWLLIFIQKRVDLNDVFKIAVKKLKSEVV